MLIEPIMTSTDLVDLLHLLSEASIDAWLDGGWGVDALLKRQTRRHNDVDIGYAVAKTLGVGIGQAVLAHALVLAADILLLGGFHGLYDDVLAAKPLDLLLSCLTGPFADGKHRDDRGYAEDYT